MIQVNHTQIPEKDILAEMQYHPAQSQRDAMLKSAESLIIAELLRQRAKTLGLDIANDGAATSQDDFLEQLLAQEVDIPTASADECEQYYRLNPGRFESSPLVEVSHILLAAAPEDDKARVEAKTLSEALISQLQQGASLAELAKHYSACPSKETGGSLGQINRGQTVPEFERQLFSAEPGLLPHAIESRYGFHVVLIARKVPGQLLPFKAVQQKIAEYLNEKVRRKAVAQYIHTLIVEAEIAGYDFKLSASPLMQ
ncbi:MAG: peptidylprolyl isomerase [Rheinheimera sp.]|uniref:peptidylprolyl isomerase n=1 Tax=Arsukibacterium sp. UBA3155 TaxID=1946058 RepID=UPI000C9518C8|nr:peptidylprolyl isomerase [Arsukibacterium sp. UBA3155]MAD74680.1 peptidylprolyl isomerase [Rheinheimera sp.]|tara:strand:+ start:118502 stop:119269 length:768 start_codon:yes stop_codon:yes gene_type:complete